MGCLLSMILATAGPVAELPAAPSATGAAVAESAVEDSPSTAAPRGDRSLANARFTLPSADDVARVLLLRDYNTRVVMLGTVLLGISAALVGVFVLLRKRSLVGDVVGHASLPGIAVAFLVMESILPGEGKSLGALLLGAALAGMAGVVTMTAILRWTRIKEDAALAIVLGVFFGFGIVMLTIVQNIPAGNSAGLNSFIFGTTASMLAADVWLIGQASLVVLLATMVRFKELTLLCFDEGFARSQGWPTLRLDLLLMALVIAVVEIGAQSVGLVLVVALMVIPAAAGRFWSDDLRRMTLASVICGAASAYLGVLASALFPRLAAGAVIVLVGGLFFLFSMLLGARRGILWRLIDQRRLRVRVGRHDLMRAWFECLEPDEPAPASSQERAPRRLPHDSDPLQYLMDSRVSFTQLLDMRTWQPARLRRLLAQAEREELIVPVGGDLWTLTRAGAMAAARAARNHRLWELYLIHYADVAPSRVDRDADEIEHILEPELIRQLELLLARDGQLAEVPPSPHIIEKAIAPG